GISNWTRNSEDWFPGIGHRSLAVGRWSRPLPSVRVGARFLADDQRPKTVLSTRELVSMTFALTSSPGWSGKDRSRSLGFKGLVAPMHPQVLVEWMGGERWRGVLPTVKGDTRG